MKKKEFIGIDVSKLTLDVFIHSKKHHFTTLNSTIGFPELIETCCKVAGCSRNNLFLCFENTGKYSRLLAVFLSDMRISFSQVPALDIKKSKGISRGKSDKVDAKSIALYAYRKRDELVPTIIHLPEVGVLRQLLTLREKLMKHQTAYKNTIVDLKDCFFEGETNSIRQTHQNLIKTLSEEIKSVDEEIKRIIKSMPDWKTNYKLTQTVKGIGPVIAMYLMIYTENFTRFSTYRKFACYAGIAPFEYASGSSVKGKTRVHSCANKQLKSLLNMAAMNVSHKKGEYRQYYLRRQQMGKNNMSTLNIIRNKIIARVFAVVKRQSPYVDLLKFAA
jgi:transposase